MAQNPPTFGVAFTFHITLADLVTLGSLRVNPTIAAGDFKISKDDGALANLTNLPTVAPASSIWVKIALTATEMQADNVKIQAIDQTAPQEWADFSYVIQPIAP